jgi:DNA modification methylase
MIELNKIYFDDCLNLLKSLPDNSVDLILTDPPYGINYNNNRRNKSGKIKTENGILNDSKENIDFLSLVIAECYRVLKDGRHIYWFGRFDALYKQAFEFEENKFIIKNELIWVKNNHGTGDLLYSYAPKHESILYAIKRVKKSSKVFKLQKINETTRHNNILEFSKVSKSDLVHDHQKPIDLLKFLIKKSSLENEIVLDMFAGSGSTLFAAKELNRQFIGCELDEHYYNLVNDILNDDTKHNNIAFVEPEVTINTPIVVGSSDDDFWE